MYVAYVRFFLLKELPDERTAVAVAGSSPCHTGFLDWGCPLHFVFIVYAEWDYGMALVAECLAFQLEHDVLTPSLAVIVMEDCYSHGLA
jgi:hypothetical protein